ncbi:glycoside hydrolase family 108 protein [Aquimarina sp. 2-A2]|uniref:glycoside hydrolase family 108 protein n=1 Tax=Aquimarina sp. 2-A2 TaxID=3382644 RepID=UPI00387F085D
MSVRELQRCMSDEVKIAKLSKLICKHSSEWNMSQNFDTFKQEIEAIYAKGIEQEEEEGQRQDLETARDEKIALLKEKIEKLSFWDKIQDGPITEKTTDTSKEEEPSRFSIMQETTALKQAQRKKQKEAEVPKRTFPVSNDNVYHFHPIAFVEHMKLITTGWNPDEYFKEYFLPTLFKHEGGYQNDTTDSGNYIGNKLIGTNHGISAPVLQAYMKRTITVSDMKNLTKETAEAIYKKNYWTDAKVHLISDKFVAVQYADMCVNGGLGNGAKIMQRALNKLSHSISVDGKIGKQTLNLINSEDPLILHEQYKQARIRHYTNLATNNPTKYGKWKNGWIKRANSFIYGKER